jgi:hypothetical protein
MPNDKIKIDIADDGTIRVDTDRISNPNHLGAEAFLRRIGELLRGKITVKQKKGHGHTHTHGGIEHTH